MFAKINHIAIASDQYAVNARFYEALRAGSPLPVTAEEGAEVVRVTARIWKAVRGRGRRPAELREVS